MKRRLVGDRLRLLNRAGCVISADAHTCYDRIVHKVAILTCMAAGVPYTPLAMMFTAIGHMNYSVRTTHGDSRDTVTSRRTHPFQGVCQGNGAGPAVWLLVSLLLIRFMHAKGAVSEFQTAVSRVIVTLMGFAFVDDTDLVVLGDPTNDLTVVLNRA